MKTIKIEDDQLHTELKTEAIQQGKKLQDYIVEVLRNRKHDSRTV